MGEVFAGRYELVDLLGQGGMGSVWRTWDRRQQTYLAAKVLGQSDAASLLRFVREQALRIHHPHVVAPLGWAAEDERVLFTMDIVTGGSVATLVGDHGPLPPSYAACLLDQLLSGLATVHAAGVVHRDVKPANLLLQATGRELPALRLSDFGIAVHMDEPRLTSTGLVIGTRGYVPPEQLYGEDPHATQDLYAVGVVGAHLLTGLPPDPVAMLAPQPPDEVPADLWELLRDLAAPRAADRPQSANEAGRRLAATGLVPAPGEPLPWLADPDPVEVFPQLPDLPPGWGPAGPQRRVAPGPVPSAPKPQPTSSGPTHPGPTRPSSAQPGPTRPSSTHPGPTNPAPVNPASTHPASAPAAPTAAARRPDAALSNPSAPDAPQPVAPDVSAGEPPVRTKVLPADPDTPVAKDARSWRPAVVPAVAAAAAVLAAVFVIPQLIDDGDAGNTPSDSPTSQPSGPANSPAPSTPAPSTAGRSTSPGTGASPEWTFPVQTLSQPGGN